jgi:hypothetical protein
LIAGAQVWIEMEVDDRRRLLAAIDPANSFSAGVSETVEIDLQIDLVEMRFRGLLRRLCEQYLS